MKNIYEEFHKNSHLQKRIISERNFTYTSLLPLINKYLYERENILDIGCGVGTIDFFIASKRKKVTDIDISSNTIAQCVSNANLLNLSTYVDFFCGDFLSLEINNEFDMIICFEVLEHIKEDNLVIKKIYELLARNGVLILSVPSKNAPLYKIGLATEFDKKVGHLRRYSFEDLESLITGEGFFAKEVIKTEGLLRNLLFLNKTAGMIVRVLNRVGFLSDIVTFFDNLSIPLFGESNIIIVARKK